MQKTNKHRLKLSVLPACGLSMALTLISMMLLTLIFALCIDNEYFDSNTTRYFSPAIQFISMLIGLTMGGKFAGEKDAVTCIASGGVYFVIQICCAMLLFDGVTGGVWFGAIAALAAIMCAIIILNGGKKRSGSKKKRNRYR